MAISKQSHTFCDIIYIVKYDFVSRGVAMFEFKNYNYLSDGEIDLCINEYEEADDAKGYVPAYLYYVTLHNSQDIIGEVDIRIGSNENTRYGGNIGYEIDEPFRGKNFAAKACLLLKEIAIGHGINKLIITCNPENIPSRKTCEKIGGTLLEIVDLPEDNEMYKAGARQKCIYEWVF